MVGTEWEKMRTFLNFGDNFVQFQKCDLNIKINYIHFNIIKLRKMFTCSKQSKNVVLAIKATN